LISWYKFSNYNIVFPPIYTYNDKAQRYAAI
jgi:hypothetical protein